MKGVFPIDKFRNIETPFYYYDTSLLRKTLDKIKQEASLYSNYHVHYAVKANANNRILSIIRETGFGADCVSGGEIKAALEAGFPAHKIVFAGVGKAVCPEFVVIIQELDLCQIVQMQCCKKIFQQAISWTVYILQPHSSKRYCTDNIWHINDRAEKFLSSDSTGKNNCK